MTTLIGLCTFKKRKKSAIVNESQPPTETGDDEDVEAGDDEQYMEDDMEAIDDGNEAGVEEASG
ncbi:hypothetical protein BLA29_014977, partial [Euroglyphus maynei]